MLFWRRVQEVLELHLEDVWKYFWQYVLKMYNQIECIRLGECIRLLKTYDQGEYFRFARDVLKASWRCLLKTKTKDVFKMSSSRQMFAGIGVVQWKLNGIKYLQTRLLLRMPTWKKHTQINLQHVWMWILSSWCIKSTLYRSSSTKKTPFFVIVPFCTPHSSCVNTSFWQDSFVWKCCVFNLSKFS